MNQNDLVGAVIEDKDSECKYQLIRAQYKQFFQSYFVTANNKFDKLREIKVPRNDKTEVHVEWAYVPSVYKNKAVFLPRINVKNFNIFIYDFDKAEFREIEIEKKQLLDNEKKIAVTKWWLNSKFDVIESKKFQNIYYYEDVAYIVPNAYPAIIKMKMDTYEIEYLSGYLEDLQCKDLKENLFEDAACFQDKFYLISNENKKILMYDMKKQCSQWIDVADLNMWISRIFVDDKYLFCFGLKEKFFYRIDVENLEIKKFSNFKSRGGQYCSYNAGVISDEYLYLSIVDGFEAPLKLNINTGEFFQMNFLKQVLDEDEAVQVSQWNTDKVVFLSTKGVIYELCGDNQVKCIADFSGNKNVFRVSRGKVNYYYANGSDIVKEQKWCGLREWIEYVGEDAYEL
jgi:hypothetical protein